MLGMLFCSALLAGDALESEASYDFVASPPKGKAWAFNAPPGGSAAVGPQGIVLRTPANAAGKSATATLAAPLEGDFDAVADYEMTAAPGGGAFAAPALEAVVNAGTRRLGRVTLAPDPGKPPRHAAGYGADEPALYAKPAAGPPAAKGGRLQIQRRGGKWTWLAAAAGSEKFETVVEESGLNRGDLKEIALALRGDAAAGEVRFTRLIVRGPPPDGVPILETVEGKKIAAAFDYAPDGAALALRTIPPSKRRLSDLVAIVPGPVRPFRARWAGQSDEDFVGPGPKEGKNGIVDARIDLSYLPMVKLNAVRVTATGGTTVWSNAPAGKDWRLHVERRGESAAARLYLEPPGDLADVLLNVRMDFADGDVRFAHAIGGPTDPKRTLAAKAPPAPPSAPELRVLLAGGDALAGEHLAWTAAGLELSTKWAGRVKLARGGIQAVLHRGVKLPEASQLAFDAKRAKPDAEDVAFVKDKEGAFQPVAGTMVGIAGGKVKFKLKGNERTLDLDRFAGVVFAAGAAPAPAGKEPLVALTLPEDTTISGGLVAFAEGRATVRTAWNAAAVVPWDAVAKLAVVEGRQRYLSDLSPTNVEEAPYLDRSLPWQRDKSLTGEPLKLRGTTYAKGLALHSRCVLTYDLGGKYAEFRSKAGFDESVPRLGRVKLRLLGDGKELLARPDFRADGEPEDLVANLAGVKEFVVEIDYGADDDTCDRVILADARLLRAKE